MSELQAGPGTRPPAGRSGRPVPDALPSTPSRPAPQARPTAAAAAPESPVLQAHRGRVAALNEAMVQLGQMHQEAYGVWDRIVKLAESEAADRYEQLDALHDEAYAIADRIARLREQTFGSIGRESLLRLTASVESIHTSLLHP
jgi:hypothetical protein